MAIIDHLSVGVPSIDDGAKFYDSVLETIGAARVATTEGFAAYGAGGVEFLIMLPYNREPQTFGNGAHVAFFARSAGEVDAFHKAALENGGSCEGEPGPRPGYPKPDVRVAYVRDPFGNKLEVIHNGFAA